MKRWFLALIGTCVLGLSALVVLSPAARAATCNVPGSGPYLRDFACSYFDDRYAPGVGNDLTFVFEPVGATPYAGLTPNWPTVDITYASFVSAIQARLFDATSNLTNEGRAAAVVDIMLGKNGTDFGGSHTTGIAYAQAHWSDWVALVAAYNSGLYPGYSVNFNVFQPYSGTEVNGWGVIVNNIAYLNCSAPEICEPDIAFQADSEGPSVDKSVVFYYPGGQFNLKDLCGNLSGDVRSLPMPPVDALQLSKTSDQVGATALGSNITYSITGLESTPTQLTNVTLTDTLPAQVSYVGPAPGTPAPTYSPITRTLTWTFGLPADAAILNSWTTGPPKSLQVIVKATAIGSGIVNTVTGTATNSLGAVAVLPGSTSNDIAGVVTPTVTGRGSDVHAGSALGCGGTALGGNITGNLSANPLSSGQYVVSAAGLISGFASAGSTNLLTLGANGGYGQICRPDLLAAAQAYNGPDIQTIGITGPVTTWNTGGKTGLYYFMGAGELDISGIVSNKITLVAPNASRVIIDGNIVLNTTTGTGRSDIPSLGVIAGNNIDILQNATEVDAYLFSDGTINTCGSAAAPDRPCGVVTPTLNVQGFLMSHDILLSRLGPHTVNGNAAGEVVTMNPELYLNPPKFFDASVDQTLSHEEERPPLF